MKKPAPYWLFLVASLAPACTETEECRRLDELGVLHQRLMGEVSAKASLYDRLKKRLAEAEEKGASLRASLGLDTSEGELTARLNARAGEIPTATVTAGFGPPEVTEGGAQQSVRLWEVSFPAPGPVEAMKLAQKLVATPPLVKLESVLKPKGGARWRAQILAATIDKPPPVPDAIKIPMPPDPSSIPTNFGFCGAGERRRVLAALRAELEAKKSRAEETTVLLPLVATHEGLRKRAELTAKIEEESRRLMEHLARAAAKAKVEVKGIGYEAPLVVLEIWGKAPELHRLEAALSAEVGQLKKIDPAPPGVIRVGLPNPLAANHRPGQQPGHGAPATGGQP